MTPQTLSFCPSARLPARHPAHALQAMKLTTRAKEINGLLGATLASLEKEKPKLQLDTKGGDRVHCELFALRIFENADRVDRAGRADMNTSKAFYVATFFFDVSTTCPTPPANPLLPASYLPNSHLPTCHLPSPHLPNPHLPSPPPARPPPACPGAQPVW